MGPTRSSNPETGDSVGNWHDTNRIQELGKELASISRPPRILCYLILELEKKIGGEVVNQFWDQLGSCVTKN